MKRKTKKKATPQARDLANLRTRVSALLAELHDAAIRIQDQVQAMAGLARVTEHRVSRWLSDLDRRVKQQLDLRPTFQQLSDMDSAERPQAKPAPNDVGDVLVELMLAVRAPKAGDTIGAAWATQWVHAKADYAKTIEVSIPPDDRLQECECLAAPDVGCTDWSLVPVQITPDFDGEPVIRENVRASTVIVGEQCYQLWSGRVDLESVAQLQCVLGALEQKGWEVQREAPR